MINKTCQKCRVNFEVHFYRKDIARFCSQSCRASWFGSNRSLETRKKLSENARKIHLGKKLSKETRAKISLSKKGSVAWNKGLKGYMAGDKHYNWHGGVTNSRDFRVYTNLENRNWRQEVFKRDSWKCKIADVNCKGQLEAHHILRWSEYPELRYQVNNGITLCHAHHPRKKEDEAKLSPYFKKLVASSH